jgi:hypothetical protein
MTSPLLALVFLGSVCSLVVVGWVLSRLGGGVPSLDTEPESDYHLPLDYGGVRQTLQARPLGDKVALVAHEQFSSNETYKGLSEAISLDQDPSWALFATLFTLWRTNSEQMRLFLLTLGKDSILNILAPSNKMLEVLALDISQDVDPVLHRALIKVLSDVLWDLHSNPAIIYQMYPNLKSE